MASELANNSRRKDRGDLDLNRSNSTANIFLGGARKSWMSTTAVANQHSSQNPPVSTPESNSRPISSSTPSASNPVSAPSPPPPPPPVALHPSRPGSPAASSPAPAQPVAAVLSPSPTRLAGMRNFPSHQLQNLASFRGNQSPETSAAPAAARNVQVPRPSNTPPSITRSPASHVQPLLGPVEPPLQRQQPKQWQKNKQQQLQTHLQQESASSLPSPDPTIHPRSHASPITAIERNNGPPPILGPSTTAFPSPPSQQAPSVQRRSSSNAPVASTPPASSLSSNQSSVPAQGGRTHIGVSSYHIHPDPTPGARVPAAAPAPQPQQYNAVLPATFNGSSSIIDPGFFKRAKRILEVHVRIASQENRLSELVEIPRAHLLFSACEQQDIVYIALHQIYCLSSIAAPHLLNLPGFSHDNERGLAVVRNLLVDNSRVSPGFLQWFVNFPLPLPELLQDPVYMWAVDKVQRIFVGFANGWDALEDKVKKTQHPPLVEDMVNLLNAESSVVQYNVFLCLCRRIHGVTLENPLYQIFMKDCDYYRGSAILQISHDQRHDQRRRENDQIVDMYREAIEAMRRNAPTGPSRVAASASSLPASESVSTHMTQRTAQIPSHMQPNPVTQTMNGTASSSVRHSPSVAQLGPQQQNFSQPPIQQGGVGPQIFPSQVLLSQTAGVVSSPVMATAPHMAQHAPPPWPGSFIHYSPQQHRQPGPQSVRTLQHPPHHPHMPAGYRVQHPSVQCVTPQQRPTVQMPVMLLPRPNVPPVMNTRPNPNRLAIHQAHLRDPVNQFISVDATGAESPTELLPHVTSFLVNPKVLSKDDASCKWEVSLSAEDSNRRPVFENPGTGHRILQKSKEGTQLYRLRCVKVPRPTAELSEHSWCVAETAWPTAIYLFVNNQEHLPRRKIHNTRDLPLDITLALREGVNNINVHFIPGPAEQKNFTYAVAVEILTFTSLGNAKSLSQPLPAAESQKRICGRLTRNSENEDDELSIVSDDLKVTLVDPFTARLFEVPTRGSHCEHTECFDQETFLQTRVLKCGYRSVIEADWRCPICRRDARPQSLIVDEFLASVRKELERTNRCDGARILQIKADGTWEVKTDDDLAPSEKQTPQLSRTASKRKSNTLEGGLLQRPKIDRSSSTPERILNENQPPTVIILD
ncbi:MIZ zinc finger domain protein [Aspergillus puulaauensis]|uniref:SP-RING-type domain-containing protein n=1 Tax=Aspergillus puulaauensis TaxID=1220207 RepID=A0A7R8AS60_9EURO|nr:uncharacterized protein APUU_70696S [Aspergillus puulaauensis]BCS29126.1 hypothetical protein APUU_70696S [Aspergillus puulaauensis]